MLLYRIFLSLVATDFSFFAYGFSSSFSRCRTQPGDSLYPKLNLWNELNETIGGRLLHTTPSAHFCQQMNCTETQWASSVFRKTIPGGMDFYNWEQDYSSNASSLCLKDGSECGQGNVPIFAVNASTAAHVQAGVQFASVHNLRLAIKSSGHDLLGRSTAKNSILIWTNYIQDVEFDQSLKIGESYLGNAVTVGAGVPLNMLYQKAKQESKFVVGGTASSVSGAGGFVQGGGHSLFSPLFGLASDVALQFNVVVANGSLIRANAFEHSDLFWALRGGGPGSWGVIINATFQTFPTFNVAKHSVGIVAPTNESSGRLMSIHAQHIFDWDDIQAGQYFYLMTPSVSNNGLSGNPALEAGLPGNGLSILTYFRGQSANEAKAHMKPLLDAVKREGFTVVNENVTVDEVNNMVYTADNAAGVNAIMGSRLIPAAAYRTNCSRIGRQYQALLENGASQIGGNLVGGGKVAMNANISSALNPKWRTAKTHVLVLNGWADNATISEIENSKKQMTETLVPLLSAATSENDPGSYVNEADVLEPNFSVTFYGSNYPKLTAVKRIYDPNHLFIVAAGVSSEEWDAYGLCRVDS